MSAFRVLDRVGLTACALIRAWIDRSTSRHHVSSSSVALPVVGGAVGLGPGSASSSFSIGMHIQVLHATELVGR